MLCVACGERTHDDVVRRIVLDAGKPLLKIDCSTLIPLPIAAITLVSTLYAVCAHLTHVLQIPRQATVTAAQVEHPLAGWNPKAIAMIVTLIAHGHADVGEVGGKHP